jgi:hypothetical protein
MPVDVLNSGVVELLSVLLAVEHRRGAAPGYQLAGINDLLFWSLA